MIYIHKLLDLGAKTAEIESVQIIRNIKTIMRFPLSEDALSNYFAECFVSTLDNEAMENSLLFIEPTVEMIKNIAAQQDPIHEPVNLQRAIQVLRSIPEALSSNFEFSKSIAAWQNEFIRQAVSLLNSIPNLRTQEDKVAVNNSLNQIFERVLRNKEMCFNYADLIHEGQVGSLSALSENIAKGYFFHVTLEEELKKLDFSIIKQRIPQEKLDESESIGNHIRLILKGVQRAYDVNMQMVHLAIIFYSYIMWAHKLK